MITCTTWVPRGVAAQNPRRVEMDEKEFERISQLAKLQLEGAREELEGADTNKGGDGTDKKVEEDDAMEIEEMEKPVGKEEDDDDLREYNLEDYDAPTEEERQTAMGMFGNIKSLAYHEPGEDDPYITMDTADLDEEEREELQILPTDNLLLVGKVEDEVAHLEVYIYEDEHDNLYVHHDIMLPAIPLCLEWLDVPVDSTKPLTSEDRANVVAIGTTDPDIEIWDLDTVDSMFPNAILGAGNDEKAAKRKKKKKRKTPKPNDEYHVGAVQALVGNRQHRNLLASASADKTVKLWDLKTLKCAKSYSYHTGQVCALAWNPTESTTLLSGSYDRTVVWADMRTPDAKHPTWGVESDVEAVRWDPHDNNYFYVSTESGCVHFHDTRVVPATPAASKPVWTLQAHDKAVSSFDINPIIPGFLVTGSVDKTVKLWNTQASSGGPSMVVSRDMDVGKIFSASFAPDAEVGFRLAVAGSKGIVTVWDTSTNPGVRRVFGHRVKITNPEKVDRLVRSSANDHESSDDEGEGVGDDDEDQEEGGVRMKGGADGWESMDE
ncbi:WD domain-containing protein [Wilcoxina mikolae CBS 423.85]|nr:WD domain-containing protein [Wilcoxina mikolae CBS 423.85]